MGQDGGAGAPSIARVDLHCHTSASFDGVADPTAMMARAAARGLTHVAVTDHDTLEGAHRAAESTPAVLLCALRGDLTITVPTEPDARSTDRLRRRPKRRLEAAQ